MLGTEAGTLKGHEVVKVTYDENVLSRSALEAYAHQGNCSPITNNGGYRVSTKDLDYQLQHTSYKYLPLTELQRTRINSALGKGRSTVGYLSPKQRKWLEAAERDAKGRAVLFNEDFVTAWRSLDGR